MNVRDADLHYIKEFEGFSPTAYYCSAGVRTIGYGHVITSTDRLPDSITEEEALKILKSDLSTFEDAVNKYVTVKLTQEQFTALVFFTFNIGVGAFKKSTLLKKLNSGDYDSIPSEMRKWNIANKKVNPGLINRREKEILIWYGHTK